MGSRSEAMRAMTTFGQEWRTGVTSRRKWNQLCNECISDFYQWPILAVVFCWQERPKRSLACLRAKHDCSGRVPFPLSHPLLHQRPIGLRRGRRLALVPALITQPARSGDVLRHVFATVSLRNQVLGGASQGCSRAGAKAQGFEFVRGGIPHRQAAVAAAALLGVKGIGSQALEFGHA
jgi:hypothetical protein